MIRFKIQKNSSRENRLNPGKEIIYLTEIMIATFLSLEGLEKLLVLNNCKLAPSL